MIGSIFKDRLGSTPQPLYFIDGEVPGTWISVTRTYYGWWQEVLSPEFIDLNLAIVSNIFCETL